MELLPGNLKNNSIVVDDIPLSSLAYLGDAVYELYIRRKILPLSLFPGNLHRISISLVNSSFHAELLDIIKPYLTKEELNIARRARNLSLTVSKRKDQAIHRLSTSFEALLGYLYVTNQGRLEELFSVMDDYIDNKINAASV